MLGVAPVSQILITINTRDGSSKTSKSIFTFLAVSMLRPNLAITKLSRAFNVGCKDTNEMIHILRINRFHPRYPRIEHCLLVGVIVKQRRLCSKIMETLEGDADSLSLCSSKLWNEIHTFRLKIAAVWYKVRYNWTGFNYCATVYRIRKVSYRFYDILKVDSFDAMKREILETFDDERSLSLAVTSNSVIPQRGRTKDSSKHYI